jgi:hypothetical protein
MRKPGDHRRNLADGEARRPTSGDDDVEKDMRSSRRHCISTRTSDGVTHPDTRIKEVISLPLTWLPYSSSKESRHPLRSMGGLIFVVAPPGFCQYREKATFVWVSMSNTFSRPLKRQRFSWPCHHDSERPLGCSGSSPRSPYLRSL